MIDKNLLMKFCNTDDERLKTPYSIGDYTYATDSMVLIKVPRLSEYPEHPKAPDPEKIEPDGTPEKWYSLADLEKPQTVGCEECKGRGFVWWINDYNEYEANCKSCDGAGKIIPQKPVNFNGVTFDQRYLALLSELPNCEIGLISKTATTPFRFDGGSGIIMPMRYRDSPQK